MTDYEAQEARLEKLGLELLEAEERLLALRGELRSEIKNVRDALRELQKAAPTIDRYIADSVREIVDPVVRDELSRISKELAKAQQAGIEQVRGQLKAIANSIVGPPTARRDALRRMLDLAETGTPAPDRPFRR